MKYDLNKKPTRGAQRTLKAFSSTMFTVLSKKSFEEVTVNEICEITNFPRATFYNYFDDKYDLVNYCWYVLTSQLHLEDHQQIPTDQVIIELFDRIYFLFKEKEELLNNILLHNHNDSSLMNSFGVYMKCSMDKIFSECINFNDQKIPVELISNHFSNTILLILESIFVKKNSISQKEAHLYLKYLLGNLL